MEKNMETIIMGYIGITIKIHPFIASVACKYKRSRNGISAMCSSKKQDGTYDISSRPSAPVVVELMADLGDDDSISGMVDDKGCAWGD